jgi:hypothetical protein
MSVISQKVDDDEQRRRRRYMADVRLAAGGNQTAEDSEKEGADDRATRAGEIIDLPKLPRTREIN